MGFRLVVERLVAIGYPAAIREFEYDHSFPVRSVYTSVCQTVCTSVVYMSVCTSVCVHLSVCTSVCQPPFVTVCLYEMMFFTQWHQQDHMQIIYSSFQIAVFAGLTAVTDRPTDHATLSVTVGYIYVHSMGDAA